MQSARDFGLMITIHTAEVPEDEHIVEDDSDISAVLNFRPDRIGHMLFLKDYHYKKLFDYQRSTRGAIPLEIAPTSNYFSLGLEAYENHPTLGTWIEKSYPFCISTDDTGVFQTTLSEEYRHIHDAYNLSAHEVANFSQRCLEHIFDPSPILKKRLDAMTLYKSRFWSSIFQSNIQDYSSRQEGEL